MKRNQSIFFTLILLSFSKCFAQNGYTLHVSEGTSGGLAAYQITEKYSGLATAMKKALGKKVTIAAVREFSMLEDGMKKGEMDFVLARPSDYPARGIRDYQYQLISTSKPDGRCLLFVPNASPLKNLSDIKGKKIVLSEKVSYMSKFCTAELKHNNLPLNKENTLYVREQEAILFYIQHSFADVGGIASYSGVAKKLEKLGYRVIHKSTPQPYMPLVAHPRISQSQIQSIQNELKKLSQSDDGIASLKQMGIEDFNTSYSNQRLLDLLSWLEK